MNKEVNALIDKSERSINAAKMLLKSGDFDFATSRAYYAIFYISEALLLKIGKSFSKHSAVISAIYEYFVKDNKLPNEFHQTLHKAFDLRQQGDYLCAAEITREVADDLIQQIDRQLRTAIDMLQQD